MNKYWIHKPSGQKAEVYREGDPMQLSWRHAPNTYIEVTKESLKEFYIPITKAEYDSDITLKEIERSRRDYKKIFSVGSIVICVENNDYFNRKLPVIDHQYQVINVADVENLLLLKIVALVI